MVDDKEIGLTLAIGSSILNGVSFVITKKGLSDTSKVTGPAGDTYMYLRNQTWWIGMTTMILGEIANFAAYSFAPATLVTPLGALSVIFSAILASYFLGERIDAIGKAGCALCLIGSIIIIFYSPEEKDITSINEILQYAMNPGFLLYTIYVIVFTLFMIFKICPKHGKKNPLVYISICSLVGSLTVIACKAFGIALKLTFAGKNQFSHISTYFFAIIVVSCILIQMNYFNKALDQFTANIVTPIYYVLFTTATIFASVTLFQTFNQADTMTITSMFCGFLTIFIGMFLLSVKRNQIPILDKLHSHFIPSTDQYELPTLSQDQSTTSSSFLELSNDEASSYPSLDDSEENSRFLKNHP